MTSSEITAKLVGMSKSCLWSLLSVTACPNSYCTGFEADLLVLFPSGRLHEIEIKVSLADLKREFATKTKRRKHGVIASGEYPVSAFWLAVPDDLQSQAAQIAPAEYGIIAVGQRAVVVRRPKLLKHRQDLEMKTKMYRSTYFKFWKME